MHSPPPSPVTKDSPTPPLPTSSPLATPTSASLPVTTLIASLSVPYYEARGGRNYVYAVRVVPDAQMSDYDYMAKRAMVKRKASVNKMDADQINFEAVQPYTIYRSWSEFQDLSTR